MEPTQDRPLLWTVRQVARLLQCASSEVYAMCRSGVLPSKRLGRTGRAIRVPREALESWVRERTPGPGSAQPKKDLVPDLESERSREHSGNDLVEASHDGGGGAS